MQGSCDCLLKCGLTREDKGGCYSRHNRHSRATHKTELIKEPVVDQGISTAPLQIWSRRAAPELRRSNPNPELRNFRRRSEMKLIVLTCVVAPVVSGEEMALSSKETFRDAEAEGLCTSAF